MSKTPARNKRKVKGGRYTPPKSKNSQSETLAKRGTTVLHMAQAPGHRPPGMSTMTNCKVVNCGTAVRIGGGAVAIDGLEVIDCGTGIEQNGGWVEGRNITISDSH
jgi:hypothetical protein